MQLGKFIGQEGENFAKALKTAGQPGQGGFQVKRINPKARKKTMKKPQYKR